MTNYRRKNDDLSITAVRAARKGDGEAMKEILCYYEGYINRLCTRKLYDNHGTPCICLDEFMKRRLERRLIYIIATAE